MPHSHSYRPQGSRTTIWRILRAATGLRANQLAHRVNVTSSYLCDVEAGRERASDALTLALARQLEAELNRTVGPRR